MKNRTLLNKLSDEINMIKNQHFFDISHANSIARLAQLYQLTIGNLRPRIIIKGEQLYLSNQHTANHIRALLLSGIRSISLWRSQGGKIWHLLINKQKMLTLVREFQHTKK